MPDTPQCPYCQAEMEAGFIPDFTYSSSSHAVYQTLWHPGTAEDRHFLGLRTGAVKIDKSEAMKIVAYCCPKCGLLREYAKP